MPKNIGNPILISQQQQIEAPQSQLVLPYQFTGISIGKVEPSVLNITRLKFQNAAPITVTNFLNGQEGQNIIVLGDGQTSIDATATVIPLFGVGHILDVNMIYKFILFDGIWYEH